MPSRILSLCVGLVALLPAFPVSGQRLDLDTPGTPKAGSGAATLALADALEREINQLNVTLAAPPLTHAKGAIRTTARNLLRTGDALGEAGHVQILAGRTIALRLAALDAMLERSAEPPAAAAPQANPLPKPELRWLAHDLAVPADEFNDVRAMDRVLRDAFASWASRLEVLHFQRAWEWGLGEVPPPWLAERSRLAGLSREAMEPFAALDVAVGSGFAHLPYRSTALALHLDAADALDLLARKPQPLSQAGTERVRVTLIDSARVLSNPASTSGSLDAARLRVRALGLTARLVAATLAADPQPAARAMLTAISDFAATPTFADDPASAARLSACIRGADLCAISDRVASEERLSRQFRPAFRVLLQAARQSAAQLMEVLPRALRPGGSALDPAVVGALNAHETRLQTLVALRSAAGIVNEKPGNDPALKAEFKAVCDRILVLGQDLGKPDRRELALAELKELVRDISNAKPALITQVETPLSRSGATPPEWSQLYSRLAGALDEATKQWLSERSGARPPADDATGDQLEALTRCLDLASKASHAAAMLAAFRRGDSDTSTLQALPMFEISTPALEMLCAGLTEACTPAFESAIRGESAGSIKLLEQIERAYAPALLVGAMTRKTDLGSKPGGSEADAALVQLVAGTPDPDRAISADARADIAGMCRYAEEWAAAQAGKNAAAIDLFKAATTSEALSARAKLKKASDHERLLNRID